MAETCTIHTPVHSPLSIATSNFRAQKVKYKTSTTYFVQTEKSQLFDDRCRTHFRCRCNLSRHLQTNFYNFQRIGEHNLMERACKINGNFVAGLAIMNIYEPGIRQHKLLQSSLHKGEFSHLS